MKRIISSCFDCNNIVPADSYGAHHICTARSNQGRRLDGDYENDIPDWCNFPIAHDRVALEWLVFHVLSDENPCISMSRGRELLGFRDMNQMREWMNDRVKIRRP